MNVKSFPWVRCIRMFEKAPADVTVNSPMAFGMIANLELQEIVLYSMMRKIDHTTGLGADMYFAVPLDMTAIEKRAYYHLGQRALASQEPLFHGRIPYCRRNCHECESREGRGQYDR